MAKAKTKPEQPETKAEEQNPAEAMKDRLEGKTADEPERRRPRLQGLDMQLSETLQNNYTAIVPMNVTREDILDPLFWTHVATRLRPMTEITIIPKDGAFYMKVFVRYADTTSARVAELHYQRLEVVTAVDIENDMFDVGFTTGQQFYVFRKADKAVLQANFQAKEDAVQWMHEHMKAMAA